MAEININEVHNHTAVGTNDSTVQGITTWSLVTCPSLHTRCKWGSVGKSAIKVSATVTSTDLAKRTGEINVQGSHKHQFKKATGSIPVYNNVNRNTCSSGHSGCRASTDLSTVNCCNESDMTDFNDYVQGEINVNANHTHDYDGNAASANLATGSTQTSCASGHSACVCSNQTGSSMAILSDGLTSGEARVA